MQHDIVLDSYVQHHAIHTEYDLRLEYFCAETAIMGKRRKQEKNMSWSDVL